MTRRRKVILWIVGGVVVAIGGLALAVVLFSPKPMALPLDVEPRDIPSSWLEAPEDPDAVTGVEPESADATPSELGAAEIVESNEEPVVEVAPQPTVMTGRLTMVGNGRPFGEEAYEVTLTGDRTTLRSTGRFWFKVVLATIQVTFEQTYEADGEFRPASYAADFNAPLGFDRSIRATIDEDRVFVEGADDSEEIVIDPKRTFTLGTFGTYTLLPRLFRLASEDGTATFDVLVFGGPPNRDAEESSGLPTMTIERAGTATLAAGEVLLDVDCYLVSSDLGDSELYAYGDEFLAFRSSGEEDSLWVYRSDFFPDGVEVVGLTSFRW